MHDLSTPPPPDLAKRSMLSGFAPERQPPINAPPAPDHHETVAGLRHFGTVEKGLIDLLKNPQLGRSDLKSEIIAKMTTLVADRRLSASDAVQVLETVPDKPFEQAQWLRERLTQNIAAQTAVLDHHRIAYRGTGDLRAELAVAPKTDPEAHMTSMQGLMRHYGGSPRRG
jgi:hypothetical protein